MFGGEPDVSEEYEYRRTGVRRLREHLHSCHENDMRGL